MFKDAKVYSSLAVDDLAKAKEFYENTLGFTVEEIKEMPLLNIEFTGGGKLMIYQKDDHKPAVFTVLNIPVDDVEKAVDDLIGKGITFEQYPHLKTDEKGISREWGVEIAWFTDPAGNIIAVLNTP